MLRRHLSFANVTAVLALLLATAGTSYAMTLPRNSVGTQQIKPSGVTATDIKTNAVRSPDVKDGTLRAADLQPGLLNPAATVQTTVALADLADGAKASYDAFCPAGQQAIGGGGRGDDGNSEETSVTSSRPAVSSTNVEPPAAGAGFTGWRITVTNLAGGVAAGIRPQVWVICTDAP
ncbi:hypothetical protein NSZ01_32400 [Nocardioides szechwanensis]|uniref:SipW-cognate class signal peptide n=1 Tax=Nocardioides szechwanensis TaxID=1005944 RepID=A0A1H0KMI1_9ACTN|nr:hypothetical protein [Nocardioides szechwanensis]GEP35472.1 hypothetical protein NSZ01_32400 [Nocardioides szechwanensis]SDO57013.1 hypothetical protein SAMN05192576_0075 [Nocardioides szechwanensis]